MISPASQFVDLMLAALSATVLRGFLVFLVASSISVACKKIAAGYKRLVWFVMILSCLIIPMIWLYIPTVQYLVRIPVSTTEITRLLTAPLVSREHYLDMAATSSAYTALSGQSRAIPLLWWKVSILLIWVAGIGVLVARGIGARLGLRRITTAAVRYGDAQSCFGRLVRRFRTRKRVSVLLSRQCAVPFTFGVIKPRIVLPWSAREWTPARQCSVLIHELAHVRQEDYLVDSIAHIVCSIFWFVPYLWVAYSRMVQESDKECDCSVIGAGIRGTEYADHLVDIVHSSQGHILLPKPYPTIGRKHMLLERIHCILNQEGHRQKPSYRAAGMMLLVCFCCVLPLFAVTCATKPYIVTENEQLYGTWVNEEYADLGLVRKKCKDVKFVIVPEGKFFIYSAITDQQPRYEARISYKEKWTDNQGNVYYKAEYTSRWYHYDEHPDFYPKCHWYVVFRINAAGDMLESVWNQVEYAEEFSHLAGWYEVHYRQ